MTYEQFTYFVSGLVSTREACPMDGFLIDCIQDALKLVKEQQPIAIRFGETP